MRERVREKLVKNGFHTIQRQIVKLTILTNTQYFWRDNWKHFQFWNWSTIFPYQGAGDSKQKSNFPQQKLVVFPQLPMREKERLQFVLWKGGVKGLDKKEWWERSVGDTCTFFVFFLKYKNSHYLTQLSSIFQIAIVIQRELFYYSIVLGTFRKVIFCVSC